MRKTKAANITYGICLICGQFCEYLPTHLRYSHQGMTVDEYHLQYPKSRGQKPFRFDIDPCLSRVALGRIHIAMAGCDHA